MEPGTLKPVMVVSHERSGTHFLMNSLGAEFDYVGRPMVNFDQGGAQLNFYDPASVLEYIYLTRDQRPEVIRKSHHQFAFFEEVIAQVLRFTHIFYVYRDPRDVAHSFRHALNEWRWFEGPKLESSSEFIRAEPCGQMMRYQYRQHPDMLGRWQAHVEGWLGAARDHPRIVAVKYEELAADYDAEMDRIAAKMGWTRRRGARPALDVNTVLTSRRDAPSNRYSAEDLDYFRARIGGTMRDLGYEI